jgi:hypothetical protein
MKHEYQSTIQFLTKQGKIPKEINNQKCNVYRKYFHISKGKAVPVLNYSLSHEDVWDSGCTDPCILGSGSLSVFK